MRNTVIAIGLDSADPQLLERWIAEGHLPYLEKLRQQGGYGEIRNTVNHAEQPVETCSTERLWTMTWTSCLPDKTGFWDTSKFYPESYRISRDELKIGCDFKEYPPFYAFLGEKRRVVAFDLPATGLSERVNGVQILGWGGHFPFTPSHSLPEQALPDLIARYGRNEVLDNDHGHWSDKTYANWLQAALKTSVNTRCRISQDFLQQEDWDLFLMTFPETHSAGHDLWHLSQVDHPVYSAYKSRFAADHDPMLETYQAVDQAIGELLATAPADAYVLCFAVHGMNTNTTDLLSMAILPELLYRYNFPGKVGLAAGTPGTPPPPVITKTVRSSWPGQVWMHTHEPNPVKRFVRQWLPKRYLPTEHNGLIAPWRLMREGVEPGWMPTMWYSPFWPQMKAFALPSFADGHIRINLAGREQTGIVSPEDYDGLCDELTQLLYDLRDARTGQPVVAEVVRTRRYPTEDQDRDRLPGPDLVILWDKHNPIDVADSSRFGRIGPLPHARPGSHRPTGFVMAKGPGIAPGSSIPQGQAIDLGPTILRLLDVPVPEHFDGKPIEAIANARIMANTGAG
ncbi:MAG: alkaline phosphatase family protein [Synechococcales bacterium]|nr:alkaline phosphatase family protein [Synechococcales bacterium]